MTKATLDAALAKISRHRGVTLRTGLDAVLARTSPRHREHLQSDADLEGDLEDLKEQLEDAKRAGHAATASNLREDIKLLEARISEARGAKTYRKDKLTSILARIPSHRRAGDDLRALLGLTGVDAALARIPDRRARDEKIKTTFSSNKLDEKRGGRGIYARTESGKLFKLNPLATGGKIPSIGSSLEPSDHTEIHDSESDIIACYRKHLAGGSSRSEAIAETATEHHVPERDVRELVGATGDAWNKGSKEYEENAPNAHSMGRTAKSTGQTCPFERGTTAYNEWRRGRGLERMDSALDRALRAIPDRRRARDVGQWSVQYTVAKKDGEMGATKTEKFSTESQARAFWQKTTGRGDLYGATLFDPSGAEIEQTM